LNDIDSESEAPYEHVRTRGVRRPRRNKSGYVPYAEDADDDVCLHVEKYYIKNEK